MSITKGDTNMRTLYFDQTGPMLRYGNGLLHVADLNPEVETRWRMSRWEMFVCGLRFALAACDPKNPVDRKSKADV